MSKLVSASVLAVLVAALAVAGCGGQKVSADEVPGPPVALKVPEVSKGGSDALAGNSSSSSSSNSASSEDSTPTPTPSATAESGSTGTTGTSGTTGTTQNGSTGGTSGTTPPQTQQGNGTNGQSQGGGDTFDDFCKNNPGAC
jgi:hypothetical protein